MVLLKSTSERKDKNGNPYVDLFLAWHTDKKSYLVRVRPAFACDNKKLYAQAVECEDVANFEKYL